MGEPVGPRTVYDWALVLFHLSVWGVLVYAVIAKGLAPLFRKIAEGRARRPPPSRAGEVGSSGGVRSRRWSG